LVLAILSIAKVSICDGVFFEEGEGRYDGGWKC
jgi:hypothetical protein